MAVGHPGMQCKAPGVLCGGDHYRNSCWYYIQARAVANQFGRQSMPLWKHTLICKWFSTFRLVQTCANGTVKGNCVLKGLAILTSTILHSLLGFN